MKLRSIRGISVHLKESKGIATTIRFIFVTNALSPLNIMIKYAVACDVGLYNKYKYGIKSLRILYADYMRTTFTYTFVTHRITLLFAAH